MSAQPPAEEEPSYDEPSYDAAGTTGWATASPAARVLWTVGGGTLILGAVVLLMVLRDWSAGLTGGVRHALGLAVRGALMVMLLGGAYGVVRGTWRD
ncbi:hypothetical protein QFZ82_005136 [Streptomyces sp. V4I23]|uniref:hypothetical protein n=1 Tax=Streptomyces sp. V4I23 TaxID=3042282 RepID=UPI00277E856F|nr:hypothetical protein [Streptomyces sp. V4I23]MDQ1010651.1 hypothetical protein [Streptomyces sp. V4I23]